MKLMTAKEILNMTIKSDIFNRNFPKSEWKSKFVKEEDIKPKDTVHFTVLPDGKDSIMAVSDDGKLGIIAYGLFLQSGRKKKQTQSVHVCLFQNTDYAGEAVPCGVGMVSYTNPDKAAARLLSSVARTIVKTIAKELDRKPFHELKSELETLSRKAFNDGIKMWSEASK